MNNDLEIELVQSGNSNYGKIDYKNSIVEDYGVIYNRDIESLQYLYDDYTPIYTNYSTLGATKLYSDTKGVVFKDYCIIKMNLERPSQDFIVVIDNNKKVSKISLGYGINNEYQAELVYTYGNIYYFRCSSNANVIRLGVMNTGYLNAVYTIKTLDNIILTNNYIKDLSINTETYGKDEMPNFGILAKTGNLTIYNLDKTLNNLLYGFLFDNKITCNIYFREKKLGTFGLNNFNYNSETLEYTCELEDIAMSVMQKEEVKGYGYIIFDYINQLFDRPQMLEASYVDIDEDLENRLNERFSQFELGGGFLENTTYLSFWNDFLKFYLLNAFINEDNRIEVVEYA